MFNWVSARGLLHLFTCGEISTFIMNAVLPARHEFRLIFRPRNRVVKRFPSLRNSGDKVWKECLRIYLGSKFRGRRISGNYLFFITADGIIIKNSFRRFSIRPVIVTPVVGRDNRNIKALRCQDHLVHYILSSDMSQ